MGGGELNKCIHALPLTQEFSKYGSRKLFNKKNVCEVLEMAKAEWEGNTIIGFALQDTHTGKRGRPRRYINVKVDGFSPEERIKLLEGQIEKDQKWFERWFGDSK